MAVRVWSPNATNARSADAAAAVAAIAFGSIAVLAVVAVAMVFLGAAFVPTIVAGIATTAPAVTGGSLGANLVQNAACGLALGLLCGLLAAWRWRSRRGDLALETSLSPDVVAALPLGGSAILAWAAIGAASGAIVSLLGGFGPVQLLLDSVDAIGATPTLSLLAEAGYLGGVGGGSPPLPHSAFGLLAAIAFVIVGGSAIVGAIVAVGLASLGAALAGGALGGLGRSAGEALVLAVTGHPREEGGWLVWSILGGIGMGLLAGAINATLVAICVEVHARGAAARAAEDLGFELVASHAAADEPPRVSAVDRGRGGRLIFDEAHFRALEPVPLAGARTHTVPPNAPTAVSPDGRWGAGPCWDGLHLDSLDDASPRVFEPIAQNVDALAFDADAGVLALAWDGIGPPDGGRVTLHRTSDGTELDALTARDLLLSIDWISFGPNGRHLFGRQGHGLIVWRIEDGARIAEIRREIIDAVWHPSAPVLAVLRYPDEVLWVDPETGGHAAPRIRLGAKANSPATHPVTIDAERGLVAIATEAGIRVHEIGTCAELQTVGGEVSYVAAAFHPDGWLRGEREDGTVELWRVTRR